MRHKYYWIADPGHEWLVVPLNEARHVAGISTFSYRDASRAYLEGDCDAARFIEHYELDASTIAVGRYYDDDAPCRSMPAYRATVTA